MDVHGSTNYNNEPAEHYNKFLKEIVGISSIEGTNSIASFGHLFGGYDAGYYGYLWSQVYAKDLFTKFVSKELDEHIGEQLKQTVLSWGGIRSSMDSMTEFLDRKPNSDYFINSL
jgi:Zn-dependent oligopeptidase